MKIFIKTLTASLLILFSIETQAIIRYVRPATCGNGNANAWINASADLQEVINLSHAGDTIFVAAGTYLPIRPADTLTKIDPNNRNNAFVLKADVAILGGFPNTGNPTLNERNWKAYPTILSGDIGKPNDMSDNCYHVVIAVSDTGTICLDGFTITKGNASSGGDINVGYFQINMCAGGGIYIRKTYFFSSQFVLLTNLVIDSNFSYCVGAGIFVNAWDFDMTVVLTNVIVSRNYASGSNSRGGGICGDYGNFILTNVLIVKNHAKWLGGGMYFYHGGFSTFTNVTVSGNVSENTGGGIYVEKRVGYDLPIRNSIIWGNTSKSDISTANVYGENNPVISYTNCLVGGKPIGNGIISNEDPLFVDTAKMDYRLKCFSPAINSGENSCYSSGKKPDLSAITTDLDGNPRIYKMVDLGAYELSKDSILFDTLSFIYNGTGQSPKTTALSGKSLNISYKKKNAHDSTYTQTKPVHAGTYTVKAFLQSSGMCEEVIDSVDFVILPREITVQAVDDTIYYGQTPALRYKIVAGSLANGDALSGSLHVDNYEVGIHAIEQGTLTAGSNYVMTFIAGTLLVWSIQDVFVDKKPAERHKNYFYFNADCGQTEASVSVTCYQCVKILINGEEQNPCKVSLPNYGDNHITITVIAQNGDMETHTLIINRPLPFAQIVKMHHCNNTLAVNTNAAHNGGFGFTSCKWFCNDLKISEAYALSVSSSGQWLSNPANEFHLELTAAGYSGILRTCKSTVSLKDMALVFYPNPVLVGQTLYIKADLDDECLKDAVIEVYDALGRLVETRHATSLQMPININYASGIYTFVLKGGDGFRKEDKVRVER